MSLKIVAFSAPLPGREEEFRRSYRDERIDGCLEPFATGQRALFAVMESLGKGHWSQIAIYDVEHDDPTLLLDDLKSGLGRSIGPSEAANPDAEHVMIARLETEIRNEASRNDGVLTAPPAPGTGCQFIVLGNAPDAVEEVFSRLYKDADLKAAMRLPGAISAQRHALTPCLGRCEWETLTLYAFNTQDMPRLIQELADCSDVMDRATGPVLMRVIPAPSVGGGW